MRHGDARDRKPKSPTLSTQVSRNSRRSTRTAPERKAIIAAATASVTVCRPRGYFRQHRPPGRDRMAEIA